MKYFLATLLISLLGFYFYLINKEKGYVNIGPYLANTPENLDQDGKRLSDIAGAYYGLQSYYTHNLVYPENLNQLIKNKYFHYNYLKEGELIYSRTADKHNGCLKTKLFTYEHQVNMKYDDGEDVNHYELGEGCNLKEYQTLASKDCKADFYYTPGGPYNRPSEDNFISQIKKMPGVKDIKISSCDTSNQFNCRPKIVAGIVLDTYLPKNKHSHFYQLSAEFFNKFYGQKFEKFYDISFSPYPFFSQFIYTIPFENDQQLKDLSFDFQEWGLLFQKEFPVESKIDTYIEKQYLPGAGTDITLAMPGAEETLIFLKNNYGINIIRRIDICLHPFKITHGTGALGQPTIEDTEETYFTKLRFDYADTKYQKLQHDLNLFSFIQKVVAHLSSYYKVNKSYPVALMDLLDNYPDDVYSADLKYFEKDVFNYSYDQDLQSYCLAMELISDQLKFQMENDDGKNINLYEVGTYCFFKN